MQAGSELDIYSKTIYVVFQNLQCEVELKWTSIKQNTAVESKSEKHETGRMSFGQMRQHWSVVGNQLKSALCSQVQKVKHVFTVHTVKHEGCVMHRVSGICVPDTMKFQDHQGLLQ